MLHKQNLFQKNPEEKLFINEESSKERLNFCKK